MKILAVGAELFHSSGSIDGQRDKYDEANSRSPQLFKVRKKAYETHSICSRHMKRRKAGTSKSARDTAYYATVTGITTRLICC
jgi:hypothetical protein